MLHLRLGRTGLTSGLLIISFSLLGITNAAAQPDAVDQRLKALEQQVAELKREAQIGQNDGGLVIGGDKGLSLKLHGYMQVDGRTTFNYAGNVDEFYVRRVRPTIDGKVGDVAHFRIAPEFGNGKNGELYDGYIDLLPHPAADLRVGKFKPPVGLERLQSSAGLLFIERGLTNDLVPNRDIGVQLYGKLPGSTEYAVGVFDGVQDGARLDGDTNDAKSWDARVFSHPFGKGSALSGLGVGVAGSWSSQGEGTLPSFKTATSEAKFFSYRSGVTATGRHTRLAPQLNYYHGPFGGFAEYVRSSQQLTGAGPQTDVSNTAWQVTASWVVTGEDATEKGVVPRDPVRSGHWLAGAVQIAARYTELTVDSDAFAGGSNSLASPSSSARAAREATVGVNWYLDKHFKAQLNLAHTQFSGGASGGGSRKPETAALARLQVAF